MIPVTIKSVCWYVFPAARLYGMLLFICCAQKYSKVADVVDATVLPAWCLL